MPAGHALGSLLCGSFPLELSLDSELYLWAWLAVVIKCRTLGSIVHRLEEWEVATKRVNREPMGVAEVQSAPAKWISIKEAQACDRLCETSNKAQILTKKRPPHVDVVTGHVDHTLRVAAQRKI